MTDTEEGVTQMPPIPRQLTKADIDELYKLTSLMAPYLESEKKS